MDNHMRVYARVDLDAIVYNMESMRARIRPDTMMAAVIKADGYGHGAAAIAKRLERFDGLWGYCAATFEEAREIRENWVRKPILILGYVFPYCYEDLVRLEIRPVVFREDMLDQLDTVAASMGERLAIHLAVDTGMSRIGITPDDTGLAFVKKALEHPHLLVEGIFTHFARADENDGAEATRMQFEKFKTFCDQIETELGYRVPIRHCSNSAGIVTYPEYNMDMVRAGITMYGLWPSGEVDKNRISLRPALSLHSHIAYIKEIPSGAAVSYGGTFVAGRAMRIATIPVGYGDGYPRSLSGKGYVLIHGKKAPILGRVCMDQLMVSIDAIPEAQEGDHVTLLGRDGDLEITAEELGDLSGRFNYELVCEINPRVPRLYSREPER